MAFVYYNANPKNLKVGDCVIRALSKATEMSWDEVYDELYQIGRKKKRMLNDKATFKAFLKNHDFIQSNSERGYDNKRITIDEFIDRSEHDIMYVISTRKHLTVVYNGDIYDTWNTGNEKSGKYWYKKM